MSQAAIIERRGRRQASGAEPLMPTFTWPQLERQLLDLATHPHTAELVRELTGGIRRRMNGKPPELVLREVLCLAWTILDEDVCRPI